MELLFVLDTIHKHGYLPQSKLQLLWMVYILLAEIDFLDIMKTLMVLCIFTQEELIDLQNH